MVLLHCPWLAHSEALAWMPAWLGTVPEFVEPSGALPLRLLLCSRRELEVDPITPQLLALLQCKPLSLADLFDELTALNPGAGATLEQRVWSTLGQLAAKGLVAPLPPAVAMAQGA